MSLTKDRCTDVLTDDSDTNVDQLHSQWAHTAWSAASMSTRHRPASPHVFNPGWLDRNQQRIESFPRWNTCSAGQFRGKLSNDSVGQLLDEISAAGFFNSTSNHRDPKSAKLCHQCNYCKITAQNGDKGKMAETHDSAGDVPTEGHAWPNIVPKDRNVPGMPGNR
jgi:hypothetical protein